MPSFTKEQTEAINRSGTNIIVSAGAGSGKTAVLSERVLTKVLNGTSIDTLLILTFTSAAALEMKERIAKKIKSANMQDQLDKIDSAYITTFDSFSLSIVRKYHYLLNITSKINITDSSILTLKKVELLDKLFEEKYNSNDKLFLNLIDNFCLKDDKEIRNTVFNFTSKIELFYDNKEYLNNYINNFYNTKNLQMIIDKYTKLIKEKINTLEEILYELSIHADGDYYTKVFDELAFFLSANTYDEFKKRYDITLPRVPSKSSEELKAIKANLKNELDNIKILLSHESEQVIKEELNSTKETVATFISLIKEYNDIITDYKLKNNMFDFIDIAKYAIKIFKENEEVAKEYKHKFTEIMIDEYQDTSDLQDLFISQISNNNVYMVGDIKQSIYRFRNANPLLFKTKYDNYKNKQGGIKIDLMKNFRSRKEVLNNINLIFNLVMNDYIGGCTYNEGHEMIFGNVSYDELGYTDNNNDFEILNYQIDKEKVYKHNEYQIFAIANDIKTKVKSNYLIYDKDNCIKRNVEYKDFCILLDRSKDFDLYKKIFEYLNIPILVYKDSNINDDVDISIIKNIYQLISCIKNKEFTTKFKYSYTSIARSYLFNIKDEVIYNTLSEFDIFNTEIYQIASQIAYQLDNLDNQSIYELILNNFKFTEKIITTGNIDTHIIIFEYINNFIKDLSFDETLSYLNSLTESKVNIKLSLNKEDSNSVKIMTIHGSKGLEYHICYFAGFEKKFNILELNEKFIYDKDIGFVVPSVLNEITNTIQKDILKSKYIVDEISEKLRLFYVALTRAKEKMIIVTSIEEQDKSPTTSIKLAYRSFNDVLNSIYNKIEPYIKIIEVENLTRAYNFNNLKVKELKKTNTKLNIKEYQSNSEIIERKSYSKKPNDLINKVDYKNIQLGIKMHQIFENIDFYNPNYEKLTIFEKNCVQKFINTKILDNAITIYKEYEFIYENTIGIIDLIIVHNDKVCIIDYKLKNTTDKAYVKQLNGYKKYLETIFDKNIEIYLYSILDTKLINLLERIEA